MAVALITDLCNRVKWGAKDSNTSERSFTGNGKNVDPEALILIQHSVIAPLTPGSPGVKKWVTAHTPSLTSSYDRRGGR